MSAGSRPQAAPRELERGEVVMSEHLGVVLGGRRERLDPLGGAPVLVRALSRGNLPVGDVAYERVAERVLRLAVDRERRSRRTNSLRSSGCNGSSTVRALVAADAARALGQKTFPMTAASWSSAFSSAASASSRAAIIP